MGQWFPGRNVVMWSCGGDVVVVMHHTLTLYITQHTHTHTHTHTFTHKHFHTHTHTRTRWCAAMRVSESAVCVCPCVRVFFAGVRQGILLSTGMVIYMYIYIYIYICISERIKAPLGPMFSRIINFVSARIIIVIFLT